MLRLFRLGQIQNPKPQHYSQFSDRLLDLISLWDQVKLMMTDLICVKRSRPYRPFSRPQLRQNPAPQLNRLRGERVAWRNVQMEGERKAFPLPATNTLKIEAEIDLQSASGVRFGIKSGNKDVQVVINFNGLELQVLDAKAPLTLAKASGS